MTGQERPDRRPQSGARTIKSFAELALEFSKTGQDSEPLLDATLVSVAELVSCSKSTVENELRRAMRAIRRNTGQADEAEAVYEHLVNVLGSGQGVGNQDT